MRETARISGKALVPRLSSSLTAALFALLPKCPACVLFLLAPLGLSLSRSGMVLTVAAVLLLAAPAVWFAVPACRGCGLKPLFLAGFGSLTMALGRFAFDQQTLVIAGAAMVIGAFLWMPRSAEAGLTSRQSCAPCSAID